MARRASARLYYWAAAECGLGRGPDPADRAHPQGARDPGPPQRHRQDYAGLQPATVAARGLQADPHHRLRNPHGTLASRAAARHLARRYVYTTCGGKGPRRTDGPGNGRMQSAPKTPYRGASFFQKVWRRRRPGPRARVCVCTDCSEGGVGVGGARSAGRPKVSVAAFFCGHTYLDASLRSQGVGSESEPGADLFCPICQNAQAQRKLAEDRRAVRKGSMYRG
jgi:hypothetical protein